MKYSESIRKILIMASMTLLYAFANYLSGKNFLPGCSFAEFRPQICVPVLMGLVFGPKYGFFTGFFGDALGYVFAGINPVSLWHWALANGLMGAIPGLIKYVQPGKLTDLKRLQVMYLLLFAATSLPFVFSVGMECLINKTPVSEALKFIFLPIFITDALFAIIIVPAFLLFIGHLVLTIPTSIFLLSTYLTSLVALVTFGGSIATIWGHDALQEMEAFQLYSLGLMTLSVIIIGFISAAFVVRRITYPIMKLTKTANAIADEDYSQTEPMALITGRTDELGALARAFDQMASKIREREDNLKSEVRRLTIQIDHTKQKREVSRITGTEYFKNLKNRAGELRMKD